MSAVENDEHTKSIEVEATQSVVVERTTSHSEETIPTSPVNEHIHTSEEHGINGQAVEGIANGLSSDDTRGEVIATKEKEETFITAEAPAVQPTTINEIHSETLEEHETETHVAVEVIPKPVHETAIETSDLSHDVTAHDAVEIPAITKHEVHVVHPDAAPEAVPTSALEDAQTLIADGEERPIVLTENTLEVCEADPEIIPSSTTSAGGLLMLSENALEVCEAEPVLPSPKIPAEALREEEHAAPELVHEESQVVEESGIHAAEVASSPAEDDTQASLEHVVPEQQIVATVKGSPEVVELVHVTDIVEPPQETVVVESEKHESVEEASEPVVQENESVEVSKTVEVEQLEANIEQSAVITESEQSAEELVEVVQEHNKQNVLPAEIADPVAETTPFTSIEGLMSTGPGHLVLLSSSDETCLADPQPGEEFEQPVASVPSVEDAAIEGEVVIAEAASKTVPAPDEPIAAEVSAVEAATSTLVNGNDVLSMFEREEAEVTHSADVESVVEQPVSAEHLEATSVEEPDVKVPVEIQPTEGKETIEPQEHAAAEIEESQTTSILVENTVPIVATEEIVATEAAGDVAVHEQVSSPAVVQESVAATEHTTTEAESHEEIAEIKAEAEVPAFESQSTTADLTVLAHEETAVCKSEEVESTGHLSLETDVPSASLEVGEATTPIIAITSSDGVEEMEEVSVPTEPVSAVEEPKVEAEHPKSPWTPSYSVTTQGPGTDVPDDSEELAALEQLPPADKQPEHEQEVKSDEQEAAPGAAEVKADVDDTEDSSKIWPKSYSVSSQGASPLQGAQPAQEVEVESIEQLPAKVTTEEEESVQQQPVSEVVETFAEVSKTDEESVEAPTIVTTEEPEVTTSEAQTQVEESAEEHSSERPWTPSYSVTQQGTSPSQTPKELPEESEEVALKEPAAIITTEEHPATPERSWTASYSVQQLGSSPSLVAKEVVASAEDHVETSTSTIVSSVDVVQSAAEDQARLEETAEPAKSEEVPERPWTPSYTVTQQGSTPLLATEELEAEAQTEAPSDVPVAIESIGEAAATASWTPSYSISQQGSSPNVVPQKIDASPSVEVTEAQSPAVVVTEESAPEATWTPSYSVSQQGTSPRLATKELEATSPTALSPEGAVSSGETAPERPWTPSYSVSQQGTSPKLVAEPEATENADVPEAGWTPSYSVSRQGSSPVSAAQALPQPAVEVSQIQAEATKGPEPPQILVEASGATVAPEATAESSQQVWASSYSVSQQGTSPLSSPAVKAKELGAVEPTIDTTEKIVIEELSATEQPERPWTPSYSVTTQGPSSPALKASAELAAETLQVFPTTEIADNAPGTKSSLSRLAPVNELEQSADKTTGEVETTSPTARRARLESTTSSRFFPGGWFSGNPKTPEENRTSLDHATGEFSRSENLTASPVVDVPVNTPAEGDVGRKRWCLIM
ncbi:hypothetical protein NM688_g4289 [Phlebia brevispora]|uniref:Uncharacterized protein n=1 Tax=Phlebia brevispora TaxID=194682 RepID=A0ACC1T3B9_9APHY|nr:hypothetical protein NM688_g4289 [Phlebia brevispora]